MPHHCGCSLSDWQEAHMKPAAGFFRSVMTDVWQSEALREILKASICKNNFSEL